MKRVGGFMLGVAVAASTVVLAAPSIAGAPRNTGKSIRVSARRGPFRCSATFPHRTIQPGRATRVRFRIKNVSDHEAMWHNPLARLAFRNAAGDLLWRTNVEQFQPTYPPRTLQPGESMQWYVNDTRVRWSGPLTVRPICVGLGKRLPSVKLKVGAPGPPESTATSIDKAVAYPGSPFQACAPGPQGQARIGTLENPSGDFPPLTVRCWADVRSEAGFDVVGLNMVSPDNAPDYTIKEGKGPRPGEEVDLPGSGSIMAGRWSFVVTDTYVRPVFSKMLARNVGDGSSLTTHTNEAPWRSLRPSSVRTETEIRSSCGTSTARPERSSWTGSPAAASRSLGSPIAAFSQQACDCRHHCEQRVSIASEAWTETS